MAATIPEYVVPLITTQDGWANLLGIRVLLVDTQTYRMNLTVLTFIGVIMKALNDHLVVLDAEWTSRLASATSGTWPTWLLQQIDPNAPPGV